MIILDSKSYMIIFKNIYFTLNILLMIYLKYLIIIFISVLNLL